MWRRSNSKHWDHFAVFAFICIKNIRFSLANQSKFVNFYYYCAALEFEAFPMFCTICIHIKYVHPTTSHNMHIYLYFITLNLLSKCLNLVAFWTQGLFEFLFIYFIREMTVYMIYTFIYVVAYLHLFTFSFEYTI